MDLRNTLLPWLKMTNDHSDSASHQQNMEQMMFASHTMNFWIPLYHYLKMGGSFRDLSTHGWIFDGVPKEYIAPPQEIEVMNDFQSFHEFRQMMITHLYKEYVENWGSNEDE